MQPNCCDFCLGCNVESIPLTNTLSSKYSSMFGNMQKRMWHVALISGNNKSWEEVYVDKTQWNITEPVACKDWFCHFFAKNFSVLFLTVELIGTFPVLLGWSPSFAYNYVVKFADLVQLPISAVVHRALSGEYNWQTLVGGCESSDHFSIFNLPAFSDHVRPQSMDGGWLCLEWNTGLFQICRVQKSSLIESPTTEQRAQVHKLFLTICEQRLSTCVIHWLSATKVEYTTLRRLLPWPCLVMGMRPQRWQEAVTWGQKRRTFQGGLFWEFLLRLFSPSGVATQPFGQP